MTSFLDHNPVNNKSGKRSECRGHSKWVVYKPIIKHPRYKIRQLCCTNALGTPWPPRSLLFITNWFSSTLASNDPFLTSLLSASDDKCLGTLFDLWLQCLFCHFATLPRSSIAYIYPESRIQLSSSSLFYFIALFSRMKKSQRSFPHFCPATFPTRILRQRNREVQEKNMPCNEVFWNVLGQR